MEQLPAPTTMRKLKNSFAADPLKIYDIGSKIRYISKFEMCF